MQTTMDSNKAPKKEWPGIVVPSKCPYPLILGEPLEKLGEYLQGLNGGWQHILVITQPKLASIYAGRLCKGLEGYHVDLITVPEGEQEKSLERLNLITAEAVSRGTGRQSLVIALGGGVIGDLAGFFASVYMRGIPFIQVPTTVLAQVDSSIGGKVAVNHTMGKNLLGAFYPPVAVWVDFSVLETLPWCEAQNGIAETIKHAVIADAGLFDFLEENQAQIREGNPTVRREMVERSLAVKVKIVGQDEHEKGERALLNLGHTFGHALETELGYTGITHGYAVGIGMVAAAYLAGEKGLMPPGQVERVKSLIEGFGLPSTIAGVNPEKLLERMAADKKNEFGRKTLILPQGIGKAVIVRDCLDEEIRQAWTRVIRG